MKKKNQRGYSLLELLVYVALFAVISVLLVHSLVTLMRTYSHAQGFRKLQYNGELVMERITREVRSAESISGGSFGTHPGTLSLLREGATVAFGISDGAVTVSEQGVTEKLSSQEVVVQEMIFRRITTPVSEGVKIELVLSTASTPARQATFYSTVMVRAQ